MKIGGQRSGIVLFLGDILAFLAALWFALSVRYGRLPSYELLLNHLIPFSFVFLVWLLVFVVADLYRRPIGMLGRNVSIIILNAQAINSVIALAFFYFIPYFGITPKITLFIDLLFTYVLIFFWRSYLASKVVAGRREKIIFLCQGKEVDEVKSEIASSSLFDIVDNKTISGPDDMTGSLVVIDPHDEQSGELFKNYYQLIFHGVNFISIYGLYEELFGRIPISMLKERWFVENISNRPKPFYDFFKRAMDVVVGAIVGIISLVFYPFVYLAIKIDDGGSLFYSQERVGKNGQTFKIYKFRSMSEKEKERVTRVGHFLRRSRIDELPQLWTVIIGQQSLIGPRPEMPSYVDKYREIIPYYDARHLIAPGLSGWAQIYHNNEPKFQIEVDNTREKLSYDLYYLKNRSLWLDMAIALRTIKRLLSLVGK